MSRQHLATAAAVAAILAAPAAQAEPEEFAGFYAGVHAGHADWDTRFTGGDGPDEGSSIGGFQIGANILLGNVVLGVETDLSLAGGNLTRTCPFGNALTCEIDLKGVATMRGRAGYATDDWLFFITGGGAAVRFDVSTDGPAGSSLDDEGEIGWTVGAGVEYLVGSSPLPGTKNVGIKLEYRYLSIGDFGEADIDSAPGGPRDIDVDLRSHIVMVGLNWHF